MGKKELIPAEVNFEIFFSESTIEITLKGWRRNQYSELRGIYFNKPLELLTAVLHAYREDLELVEMLTTDQQ